MTPRASIRERRHNWRQWPALAAAIAACWAAFARPASPAACQQPGPTAQRYDVAIAGARVYPSPTAPPLENATVLVQDGVIAAIGARASTPIPAAARVIDATGKFVTAGFWNGHVHFMGPEWRNAASAEAGTLANHVRRMLTRWGFTTVFDLASDPRDTLALRRRIDTGDVPGPRIYTTAGAIFPQNGIPVYVPAEMAAMLKPLEAADATAAAALARQQIANGADGIKVFAGAIVRGGVLPMPVEHIRAAVEVAHAAGKPVFAHPSNRVGVEHALAGDADVLAHTIPMEAAFTPDAIQHMARRRVALVPTLALFPDEVRKEGGDAARQRAILDRAVHQVRQYFQAGGPILFGTDVGYTQLYDPTTEYEHLQRAGMTWRDILAALTTNQARTFGDSEAGELAAGRTGDLVVLDADPATDVRNFARVSHTIRRGRILYAK